MPRPRRCWPRFSASLTQRQRKDERIQQIRLQAEDAISHNRFDQSLSVLESGLELDASNPELVKLRERAQREKEKQDKINEFMQQAETARRKGDFKNAIAAAQKALNVDKTNPRIVALEQLLTQRGGAGRAPCEGQVHAGFGARRDQLPPL